MNFYTLRQVITRTPRPYHFPHPARSFHSSIKSCDFIGPSDPVSNLRPILYDDAPSPPTKTRHPYSLREFTEDERDHELQYKLQRQQLDAFNHKYWTDSNTRFEALKQSALDSLPSSASTHDRESALSVFYKDWVIQEKQRQDEYSDEWRARNVSLIMMGARVEYQRFKNSLFGRLVSSKAQ